MEQKICRILLDPDFCFPNFFAVEFVRILMSIYRIRKRIQSLEKHSPLIPILLCSTAGH